MTIPTLEVTTSREAEVGGLPVRRALPRRARRTVGAWCFADHLGPVAVGPEYGPNVGPHPHTGLQTVTWLRSGELLHRDSLGSEQLIRPGQLNLMTAGHGVSHSEEATSYEGTFHGIQLWVAQPEETRHGQAAFEHHGDLPQVELEGATATVLVGILAEATSPARRDTDHFGAEVRLGPGSAEVPVNAGHEHGIIVLEGAVEIDGQPITPGHLAALGPSRAALELTAREASVLLLLGGEPFESEPRLWWNFVGRTREELVTAVADWNQGSDRFGETGSTLARLPSPVMPDR